MAKGKVHEVFQKNLEKIAEQDGLQSKMIRGKGVRPWNRPEQAPDPLDIPKITEAYDRNEIDTNYAEQIQSGTAGGTCGDVISLKTQGDYIALMERGFRARHATPIRCIGHAMVRRNGHSKPNGIFLGSVLVHVQNALKAGHE